MDDGDASPEYVRRRREGNEPLTRHLRRVMYDPLPCELTELALLMAVFR